MRRRDARDLAALAQAALRELTPLPEVVRVDPQDYGQLRRARSGVAVAGVVLGHLRSALQAEYGRKRRRPDDAAAPAAAHAADTLEVIDPTDGQHLQFTRAELDDHSAVEAGAVAYMTRPAGGHYLHRTDALKLAEWLTAVACEAPRGES